MTMTTVPPAVDVHPDVAARVFRVPSRSVPGHEREVRIFETPAGWLRTTCSCPGHYYARKPRRLVACFHGRAVASLLAALGDAEADPVTNDYRLTLNLDALFAELATAPEPATIPDDLDEAWTAGYRAGWAALVAHLERHPQASPAGGVR